MKKLHLLLLLPGFLFINSLIFASTAVPVFGKAVAYDGGEEWSEHIAVADVNGDGIPDVIVGNSKIHILLGNGDGTLQPPVDYYAGDVEITSIAVGDLNGDGKPDLVVSTYYEWSNPNSGGIEVLFNEGNGSFGLPTIYPSGGYYAISIAIADLNGDGHPDLIAGNQCPNSTDCTPPFPPGAVGILLGNGDGSFQPPVSYSCSSDTQWVSVADVNGDGFPDIVTAGIGADAVLINNGDGTFQPFINSVAGGDAFAIGDVNGDGKPDIVQAVLCPSACPSAGIDVFLGNGDGTFQSGVLTDLPVADDFVSLVLKDLNGDGQLDVAVDGYDAATTWVLLGNGDGTFQAAIKYPSRLKRTSSIVLADLNGDSKSDLVMGSSCEKANCTQPDFNIQVLLNIFDTTTTTAIASSLNPSQVNQSVTFTATVTSSPAIPDGEIVSFSSGKNTLGTGMTKSGVASLTIALPEAKIYTVKATYEGDLYHKTSVGTIKQVVTH